VPIRIRLALSFALATLVIFGVSAYLFDRSFRHGVESSLDPGLRTQADTLARQVRAIGPPVDLGRNDARPFPTRDLVAQVLNPDGTVFQATKEAGRRAVISDAVIRQARHRAVSVNVHVRKEGEHYRVLAEPVSRSDHRIALVATSLEPTDGAVRRVEDALVAGGALAVALTGIGAWFLAAAALRPVERMRREAAEISEHDADSRLRVPATRDEIAALGATMNGLLARLQGALARERAFVADASHELRTPLAVLRTELELAARPHRTREQLYDGIRHAVEDTKRLGLLAEELLLLARCDEERGLLEFGVARVAPLLERSVETARSRATERGVTISLAGESTVTAPVNPDLLSRAIDNLLDNALRYAPTASTITVRARRHESQVVIEVLDEGPGFPPEFLAHAFERFRRVDDARSRTDGGAGLGLAIVLAVAKAHRGSAEVANGADIGAVITIRIPTS